MLFLQKGYTTILTFFNRPFISLFKYVFLLALLIVPVFGHLDKLPIRIWDEARITTNAYEMTQNGNYIVTYANGEPDMWNTKPPLLVWFQIGFIKLIGFNEVAMRLPSAIAALLTCIALLYFSIKHLDNFWLGFVAILVLITSEGYVNLHSTRTGDYDALLTLLTTVSCFSFFLFIETDKPKFLYAFFVSLSLAVLTKSVAGLLFLPGLFLYLLWRKKFLALLRTKHLYITIGIFLFITVGYYFLREYQNPGYIDAVYENELGGRYASSLEGHEAPFSFFFDSMVTYRFNHWYLLLPCGILFGLLHKNTFYRNFSFFLLLSTISFFLIISMSQTKCHQYDIPLYPLMAFFVALFLCFIFESLKNINTTHLTSVSILPYLFLFMTFIIPYSIIFKKTQSPQEDTESEKEFYAPAYYMKDLLKKGTSLKNQTLVYEGYNLHNKFYAYMLHEKGIHITIKEFKDVQVGDTVIIPQQLVKDNCDSLFTYTVLNKENSLVVYNITGKK